MRNAARIMQAGAHMVKWKAAIGLCDTVHQLTQRGIPVCGHLGLTPSRSINWAAILYRGAMPLRPANLADAKSLEQSRLRFNCFRMCPQTLAEEISQALTIPTIGIGAGPNTDAQVLVINDILGLTEQPPKFSKNFLLETGHIAGAMQKFVSDVKMVCFQGRNTVLTPPWRLSTNSVLK